MSSSIMLLPDYDSSLMYANSVWAPDVPSFVTVTETTYGMLPDWENFMRYRFERPLSYEDTYIAAWQRWLDGEVGVELNVGYVDEEFMRLVNVLGTKRFVGISGRGVYNNIYGFDYDISWQDLIGEVAWIDDNGLFVRAIKYESCNFFLDDKLVHSAMCDPGIVVFGDNGFCGSTLYLVDKTFESRDAAQSDMRLFTVSDFSVRPLSKYIIADG